jgi:hypothetical protein
MKDFTPHQEAFELKDLGFDEECLGYYNIDPYFKNPSFRVGTPFDHQWCLPAPTYSQAFRFFREKYELSSWVYNSHMDKYFYTILQDGRIVKATESATTYEEAELACLKKLIEISKTKYNVSSKTQ